MDPELQEALWAAAQIWLWFILPLIAVMLVGLSVKNGAGTSAI
jgi:hypothetical protein